MDTLNQLKALVETAETFKSAYFFKPPMIASIRRSYEKRNSHDEIAWDENGHHYTASYTVRCTCGNVYANGNYTRDGKKTNLTAIKNSLNRLLQKGM